MSKKLSDLDYDKESSHLFIEEDDLITFDTLIDTGYFLKIRYKRAEKHSSTFPDVAVFIYMDKSVKLGDILNLFNIYSLRDGNLSISTIADTDPIFLDDRLKCKNISSLMNV